MDLTLRPARREDVPAIVALLAADPLGAHRESAGDPLPESYGAAFDAIDVDPNHEILVADVAGDVVGALQLSFLPNLTYQGGWRAQVEGVRVSSGLRRTGIGERLVRWAIDRAVERRCQLVQLTTDNARPEAIRFYERLGFRATHVGMKLHLR